MNPKSAPGPTRHSFIPLQIALFSLAITLTPAALLAQDPMSGQTPQQQPIPGAPQLPANPGQMPNPAAQDSAGEPGMTGAMMQDKMFLRKAVEGGLAQVRFGQLAAQKASSDDLKAFGQKMVADHTDFNQQLAPFADSLGVMLPKKIAKDDQAELDKLNALSGSAFDAEYITLMIRDHHQDLHQFRLEIAGTADPDLKLTVIKGSQTIHNHAEALEKLAQDNNIPIPTRKGHDQDHNTPTQ